MRDKMKREREGRDRVRDKGLERVSEARGKVEKGLTS